jgi:hypothetical protein
MTAAAIEAEFEKYNATDIVRGLLPDPDPTTTKIVDDEDVDVVAARQTTITDTPAGTVVVERRV